MTTSSAATRPTTVPALGMRARATRGAAPVSLAAWGLIALSMLTATALLAARPALLNRLTREDSIFEWLTFLLFLASGLALLRAGWRRLRASRGVAAVLLLAGVGFLWAAGRRSAGASVSSGSRRRSSWPRSTGRAS